MASIDWFYLFLIVSDFSIFAYIGGKRFVEFTHFLASMTLVFVVGEVILPRKISPFPVESILLIMNFIGIAGYLTGRLARTMYYDRMIHPQRE